MIDIVLFQFLEIWPTGNRQNHALCTGQKISPAYRIVATAQITPKIYQDQRPTIYSECKNRVEVYYVNVMLQNNRLLWSDLCCWMSQISRNLGS